MCGSKLPLACKASFYGLVVWVTGLAGSGKSTICKELYVRLRDFGSNVVYLDGDELRDVLGAYSYDKQGRISVAKKRADLARLLSRQGVITIVSTISMFDEIYQYNRGHFPNYLEIYISCAYEELMRRDQKQLYSKALKGELVNVVGVDIEYDEPKAHLQIDNTTLGAIDEKVGQILVAIQSK
ncbi:adenylyl-sulfate kinase [Helicobacter sp.]|uniref:adenylyl-sulfate kinase n=1 Tax=Helicobacter sp. TaxID=218 RepID=UPI0025C30E9D|nr:adenylyl-sulfate kinase [Helicobacter sp.]MBR2494328.1 adenylyl-sulfate kinase [Helicobacter sp.]